MNKSIIIIPDARWVQHKIILYSIWETIKSERLWQGYTQTQIPCNGQLIETSDAFVEYYIGCMERFDWKTEFVIKLNFRDCWGHIYNTRNWKFKEII